MYTIELEWKSFKIDLVSFESHMRANYPTYVGNQAHSKIEMYFSEDLPETDKQDIITFYESLTETEETRKTNLGSRASFSAKDAKIKEIKLGMIPKARSKYTAIEKKIELGLELDSTDWDSLL